MKKILEFENNNIKYCLFKEQGNFVYAKEVNEKLDFNLTKQEKEDILSVAKQIVPKDGIINLGKLNIEEQQLIHLFDKNTKMHLFYQIEKEKIKLPNKDTREFLNNIYNHQPEYVSIDLPGKKHKKMITRFLKLGKKTVAVLLSATIAFALVGGFSIEKLEVDDVISYEDIIKAERKLDLENIHQKENVDFKIIEIIEEPKDIELVSTPIIEQDETVIDVEENETLFEEPKDIELSSTPKVEQDEPAIDVGEKATSFEESKDTELLSTPIVEQDALVIDAGEKEISYEEKLQSIYSAIEKNPNLSEAEKAFFTSCPEFFEENLENFNLNWILPALENFHIVYTHDISIEGVEGCWHYFGEKLYTMEIFGTSFEDCNKDTLTHEFCHIFSYFDDKTYCSALMESINTIINNEYFGKTYEKNEYDKGYYWLDNQVKALLEIINKPELLKQFYANPNINLIVEELMSIIPDEAKAYKLISNFDAINNIIKSSRVEATDAKLSKSFYDENAVLLKEFYEAKYGTRAEDNQLFMYYLDRESLLNDIASELQLDELSFDFV